MADALAACKLQYERDHALQRHCCAVPSLTEQQKATNRTVFNMLCQFQEEINTKGSLPYEQYDEKHKKPGKDTVIVVKSSLTGADVKVSYPEGLTVPNPRLLKQVMPIPDIHKVSDCDTIYRFLIARKFDVNLTISDLLNYFAFREKYNLNSLLWDAEVESMVNGLDGEELLRQTIDLIAKRAKDKGANPANAAELREKVNLKKIKVPRMLLQPGWSAWNCGVDKTGHVLFYQRPNPKELALLERRWKYVENQYDFRNPDFHAVTPPCSNLLVRLYLRHMEKGRRISRLLNYNNQYILREGLKAQLENDSSNGTESVQKSDAGRVDGFHDNGGGIDCLVDVGSVKVSHLTGSKCRDALKVFRLLSLMGQSFYPENMKRMIIVNGGFVFNMLFKLIRPWLDPQTQRKIVLLSATNKASVEDMSGSDTSPSNKSAAAAANAKENDDDSEDEDSGVVNDANFGLRKALSEYIDDHFIPSWYGGKLQAHTAPLFYGSGTPQQFADSPYFPLAKEKLHSMVLPDLLTDAFLYEHAEEGKAVTDKEFQAFCAATKDTLFKK